MRPGIINRNGLPRERRRTLSASLSATRYTLRDCAKRQALPLCAPYFAIPNIRDVILPPLPFAPLILPGEVGETICKQGIAPARLVAFAETRSYVSRVEHLKTLYRRGYGQRLGPASR